jgi:hypothetical protein
VAIGMEARPVNLPIVEHVAQIRQALRWSLDELEILDRIAREETSREALSLVRRALSQLDLFEVSIEWKQKVKP